MLSPQTESKCLSHRSYLVYNQRPQYRARGELVVAYELGPHSGRRDGPIRPGRFAPVGGSGHRDWAVRVGYVRCYVRLGRPSLVALFYL